MGPERSSQLRSVRHTPVFILFGSTVYTTTVLPIPAPGFQEEESLGGGWKMNCLAGDLIWM